MKDFINDLARWGCNVDTALERFDGDRELYVECLEIFDQDKNFSDLGQLLQSEKYSEAYNCAHALQGVTANLSLTPLLEIITAISVALKQGLYDTAVKNYKILLVKKEQYDKIVNP